MRRRRSGLIGSFDGGVVGYRLTPGADDGSQQGIASVALAANGDIFFATSVWYFERWN